MFLFSRINVRANDISIGPTSKERFVFEVFWNFNSSIKNWHSYADISFTFSASEETAVGGNDSSVYLSVKALNSLQSYNITSILDRHTPTTFVTFLPHAQRELKSLVNWWQNKQDAVSKQSYL